MTFIRGIPRNTLPAQPATPGKKRKRPRWPSEHRWEVEGRKRTCSVCGQSQYLFGTKSWLPSDIRNCAPATPKRELVESETA